MTELAHPAAPDPTAPVLRHVEWIASDPESGVLRLRGEFPDPGRVYPVAPLLRLRDENGSPTQRAALNEDRPGPDGWRAAYLVAGALLGGAREKWLEWPDGTRLDLPEVDVSTGDGRVAVPPPDRGAEVFDRAVLAERRAQRAESAQRAQARAAEAAVAALGALERRVEELTRERDGLARAQVESQEPPGQAPVVAPIRLVAPAADPAARSTGELEAARAAQREAEQRESRHRQALDDALRALGRLRVQVAEIRLRMRTQRASAAADAVRLAVLEDERRGFHGRLQDLRAELEALRARVAHEQELGRRLTAELEALKAEARGANAEREGLREALERERRARARSEQALQSEHAAARAGAARVAELEAELADERRRVDEASEALARRVEDLGEGLRRERSARASLEMDLRVVRSRESAARAEAATRAAAQAELLRDHAQAVADAAALRRRLAARRAEADRPAAPLGDPARAQRRMEELEAELGDTRAALEAARGRLRAAATAAAVVGSGSGGRESSAAPTDADAQPPAEPPRPALSPAVAAALRQRVASLQDAAARTGEGPVGPVAQATTTPSGSDGVAARLDAAAASLRAAAGPASRDEEPAAGPAPAREPDESVPAPSRALAVRPVTDLVRAQGPVADADAAVAGDARHPSLRDALIRLAGKDPFAAARLLAGLLPAQGAFLREDLDYDLTIRELGTFAVTVAAGRTSVRLLTRPRARRDAEMHLTAHALTLAELLAGRQRRVGRLLSPVRLRGSRRGLEVLAALPQANPSLAEVARAGAVLDPALLVRVLPHVIGPADTQGHSFTVAQELVDQTTRTWYLTADERRGLSVTTRAPGRAVDARVTMSRATFDRLLRVEALDSEHKPWVRGDFTAVEALRRWIDAARA